jgi:hypothetical protein
MINVHGDIKYIERRYIMSKKKHEEFINVEETAEEVTETEAEETAEEVTETETEETAEEVTETETEETGVIAGEVVINQNDIISDEEAAELSEDEVIDVEGTVTVVDDSTEEEAETEIEETTEEIELDEEVFAKVTCYGVNIRKEANTNAEVLKVAYKDNVVTILEVASEDFVKVKFDDVVGYCMSKFLKKM